MKIVITGANGYIGRNIIEKLINLNYKVFALTRNTSDISSIDKYLDKIHILKVANEKVKVYDAMEKIKPDILIHLAGEFVSEHSKDNIDELLKSNIVDATVILDAACNAGCRCIINTGTYWQNYNNKPYDPVNLYAATKESFENIIEYYIKAFNCKAITLKLFDTYGSNDPRRKILNILNNLNDGENIDMTQGEQYIYLCNIKDVVRAYLIAIKTIIEIECGSHVTYSIRGDKPQKLKEIVETYLNISNKKVNINWGGRAYRKREIMNPLDCGDMLPGWTPEVDLFDGIKEMISVKGRK